MTRCTCTSSNCPRGEHAEPQCSAEARQVVRSRDFDEGDYPMCVWCAMDARVSGMFEKVSRHDAVDGRT